MPLQEEFDRIQRHLHNIPGAVSVFFEAHYWGKFRLLTNAAELFPDPSGWIPLAQSQFPPFNHWLLVDTAENRILMREGDEEAITPIAASLSEFLGPWETFTKMVANNPTQAYFNQRRSLTELLPPTQFLTTPINDPEFFEDLQGYFSLLDFCKQLSNSLLDFTQISGLEEGRKKILQLHKGEQKWTITLDKDLYDNQFLVQLNAILPELGEQELRLFSSVSEEMRMVLLLLNSAQQERLDRMGLLI